MSNYHEIEQQGEEAFAEYIRKEASEIIRMVNSDEIKRYNEEIQQLRDAFHMPQIDDWTKFDELINYELVGRKWLFDKIKEWENDRSGSNILMLYGKPGAGKSMFSAHLQMRDPAITAAFPCDCRRSEYRNTRSIIINLSYRLALRLPDYRSNILLQLSDKSFDFDDDRLFDRLILTPLSCCNIDGGRSALVTVVDALDEAENDELAKFISNSAQSLRKYVRFLITSRKTPSITERFNKFPCIDLDAEQEHIFKDLAEYFESRLGEKFDGFEGKDAFISRLVNSSGLVFTYAKCVCDNIIADIDSGKFSISDYPLPSGIEELFKQTLDRSFDNAKYTMDDYHDFWQIPLGMILASPEPMTASTLRTLMQWRERDMQKFISPFSTIIEKVNGTLVFFHKSFGEWLSTTQTDYAASYSDGISDLADACFDVYSNDPESIDDYILLYMTQLLRKSTKREHRRLYQRVIHDKDYIKRLFNKAEECKKFNSFSLALDFYYELNKIIIKILEENSDNDTLWASSKVLTGIASIFSEINKEKNAIDNYIVVLKIRKYLINNDPDNIDYVCGYINVLNSLAKSYLAINDINNAKKYNSEAGHICKKWIDNHGLNSPKILAICIYSLATTDDVHRSSGDDANDNSSVVLEIGKHLLKNCPDNLAYRNNYACALLRVADKEYKAGNEDALVHYLESIGIFQELAKNNPDNTLYVGNLSLSLERIACYKAERGDKNALAYFKRSLDLYRLLWDNFPENRSYFRSYFRVLKKTADYYEAIKDIDNALDCYRKLIVILNDYCENEPENEKYYKDYSVYLKKTAVAYESKNDIENALKYYLELMKIRECLKDKYPDDNRHLHDYSVSLNTVACLYAESKKYDKSTMYFMKELEVVDQMMKRLPENMELIDEYAATLFNLGCFSDSDHKGEYLKDALSVAEQHPDLPNCAKVLETIGE